MPKRILNLCLSSILLTTLLVTGSANASVIYSSLNNGFDGWLGYVEYDNFAGDFGLIDNIDPITEFDNNYIFSGDEVILIPTEEPNGVYYYIVGLTRAFTLSAILPNHKRSISISSLVSLGDFFPDDPFWTDNYTIRITNLDTNEELVANSIDGSVNADGTDVFDITSWGAATIEIDLQVADFAGEINSSLNINRVSIRERAAEVPAPSTLSIAVLLFFISRLRTKKHLTI